jgi:hypothetical protein
MSKGKDYELLSAEVVRALNHGKKTTHDAKIVGILTEVQRQIDVKLDESEYDFAVYECKNWKDTVGIDVVEKLLGDLEDVGAKHGAIIANSPFTKGAKNLAAKKGVDLLHLVKTDSPLSKIGISAEVLAKSKVIDAIQLSVSDKRMDRGPIYSMDPDVFKVFLKEVPLTVRNYVKRIWNNGLNETAGNGLNIIEIPNARILDINSEEFTVSNVTINCYIKETYHEGKWLIEEASGLYNVHDHTFHAFGDMKSATLNVEQMEKEFREITAEDAEKKQYSIILEMATKYN